MMSAGSSTAHQITLSTVCIHAGKKPKAPQPQGKAPVNSPANTPMSMGSRMSAPRITTVTITPADARPRNSSSRWIRPEASGRSSQPAR
jgi:hypothetical protein